VFYDDIGAGLLEAPFFDPSGDETMSRSRDMDDAADDAAAQISQLRRKVEMLMSERVTPALAQAGEQAESALNSARGALSDGTDVVSQRVRDQPIMALLIASGVGFLLGRILR
jgi:ElaB/YqjD/DUF883 family membrane-anchored ribosome-binding protein